MDQQQLRDLLNHRETLMTQRQARSPTQTAIRAALSNHLDQLLMAIEQMDLKEREETLNELGRLARSKLVLAKARVAYQRAVSALEPNDPMDIESFGQ